MFDYRDDMRMRVFQGHVERYRSPHFIFMRTEVLLKVRQEHTISLEITIPSIGQLSDIHVDRRDQCSDNNILP